MSQISACLQRRGGGKNEEMRKVDARKRERKIRGEKEKKRKEKRKEKKRKEKKKKKRKKRKRSSALGIRMWSPTILLTQPTDA